MPLKAIYVTALVPFPADKHSRSSNEEIEAHKGLRKLLNRVSFKYHQNYCVGIVTKTI